MGKKKKVEEEELDKEVEEEEEKNMIDYISLDSLDLEKLEKSIVEEGCLDQFLSLERRLKYIYVCVCLYPDSVINVINTLNSLYSNSYTSHLKEYLLAICKETKVETSLKIEIIKILDSLEGIKFIIENEYNLLPSNVKIDLLCILSNHPDFSNDLISLLKDRLLLFFLDKNIDSKYRYRMIITIESKIKSELHYLLLECCKALIIDLDNTYKILAYQYLLSKGEDISKELLSIASNESLPINTRADASDVLLTLGNEEMKEKANKIILKISFSSGDVKTYYNNSQNVHNKNIADSSVEILKFLIKNSSIKGDFNCISREIMEYSTLLKINLDILENVLSRIYLDRAPYTELNVTLAKILMLVWSYICDNENRDEMKKRFLEELLDSHELCSSGYAERMLNSLSGFELFSLKISFEDQVVANLQGRLNARLKLVEEEKRGNILSQMTCFSYEPEKRGDFLIFLRSNLTPVREEMRREFLDYITDEEFDLYFRKALMEYGV